jgi:LmbE family N-acetylglucosaminyl deacetylase
MNEMIDIINEKDILFIVAHHDDEVFAFGALLVMCLKHAKSVVISAMSNIRPAKFDALCKDLNITGTTHDLKKFGKGADYYVEDIYKVSDEIDGDICKYLPDIIVTHSNRIDGTHFHPYHIICNLAVKYSVKKTLPIIVRADFCAKYHLPPSKRSRKMLNYYLGDGKNKWRNSVEQPQHYDVLEKE